MTEIWREVVGYPDYQVSDEGNVLRLFLANGDRVRRVLQQGTDEKGYLSVTLSRDGSDGRRVSKRVRVNVVVCEAFHGLRPGHRNYWHACHNNGKKTDNRSANLRWATVKDNCADKIRHGTLERGEAHSKAKLTDEKVRYSLSYPKRYGYKAALARELGVAFNAVQSVIQGKTWRHVGRGE